MNKKVISFVLEYPVLFLLLSVSILKIKCMSDYELLVFHKLENLFEEAKKTDNPLTKDIEELIDDAKAFIRQKENLSLMYLMGSTQITHNKEAIAKLLAYLDSQE